MCFASSIAYGQKKNYDEFIVAEVVDTLAIPQWADSIRNAAVVQKVSLDSINAFYKVWNVADSLTKKAKLSANKQLAKEIEKEIKDERKKGSDLNNEKISDLEYALKRLEGVGKNSTWVRFADEGMIRFFLNAQNFVRWYGRKHSIGIGSLTDEQLIRQGFVWSLSREITEDYYRFAKEHNKAFDKIIEKTDEELVQEYSKKNPLPRKMVKYKNPDYNPAELEWAWFVDTDERDWKKVVATFPIADEYHVHPEHAEYKIRKVCRYPKYNTYVFAFKGDVLAVSKDITEETPQEFLTSHILSADYKNNKYKIQSESPDVIKYVEDMIYNDGKLEAQEDWKRMDDERALNVQYNLGEISLATHTSRLMKIRSRQYPGREKAHAYVNQLKIDNGIGESWGRDYGILEKRRLSGTSFYYKMEHNSMIYEIEAEVNAEIKGKDDIQHKTTYTMIKEYKKQ